MTISENRYDHPDHVGDALLRLDAILAPKGPLPISRSGWWAGVKSGEFPEPAVRRSKRLTLWRGADVLAAIERLVASQ